MDKIVKVAKLEKEFIEFTDGSVLSSNVKYGTPRDFGYVAVDFTNPINDNTFKIARDTDENARIDLLNDEFDLKTLHIRYNMKAKVLILTSDNANGYYYFPIYKEERNNEDTILQITLNGKVILEIDDEFFTKKQTIAILALSDIINYEYNYQLTSVIQDAILEE